MAGIGFALQKLLSSKSLSKKIYAFIIATFISSGPWLFSMFSLLLVNIFSSIFFTSDIFLSFRVSVIYVYAFSIICSGPIQYLLTKYLADQHYVDNWHKFYPGLFTAILLQVAVLTPVIPLWIFLLQGASVIFILGVLFLFFTIIFIWLMMDFLSASKRYISIVMAFFIGSGISFGFTMMSAIIFRNENLIIWGFTSGQIVLFLLLFFFAGRQFPFRLYIDRDFLQYLKKYPEFLIIGGAYNAGLWIDKIIFWVFKGRRIVFNYFVYDPYDFMIFIAYLSIIPALALFLLKSETSFFISYHKFYKSVTKSTLGEIEQNYIVMKRDVYKGLLSLIIVQFSSAAVFYFLTQIFPIFTFCRHLSFQLLGASSFQILFLFSLVYLMYFDLRPEAIICCCTFFSLNIILNIYSMINPAFQIGFGYLTATFVSFCLTVFFLRYRLEDIVYQIFRKQIIP